MSDYVVVTAVSSHRMRYVMHKDDLRKLNTEYTPTDQELTTWALDCVAMEEVEDFSQMHIGEQIIDAIEMSEDEMLDLFDADNSYMKNWDRDQKIRYVRRSLQEVHSGEQERYHDYIKRMYTQYDEQNQ